MGKSLPGKDHYAQEWVYIRHPDPDNLRWLPFVRGIQFSPSNIPGCRGEASLVLGRASPAPTQSLFGRKKSPSGQETTGKSSSERKGDREGETSCHLPTPYLGGLRFRGTHARLRLVRP